jgi:hypothetical protein
MNFHSFGGDTAAKTMPRQRQDRCAVGPSKGASRACLPLAVGVFFTQALAD